MSSATDKGFQLFDYRLQKNVPGPALFSTSWHNLGQISNIDGANNGMDTCGAKVRCGVLGLLLQHGGPQTPAPLFVPNTSTLPRRLRPPKHVLRHHTLTWYLSTISHHFAGMAFKDDFDQRISCGYKYQSSGKYRQLQVNAGKGWHHKIYNTWQLCVLYSE